ncbi:ABC transporter ATP-binding protein [Glycomyces harbinensis]|uniref:ABC-2 type transport system ATP-binding protein n=1 Tax=Glycomyces harbinensis TaxID=58114 RepID=A0A1G7BQX8_9ACTN|nr:ABC transporter ATP-binding protein [Glycomyces harbinensis]SDE29352.1 ABC-2 type transport system ATP-binding protein [Glycomyces harbinensis]
MNAVIRTEDLVKRFGHVTALDHLNLEVSQGETHGFLGPNGAGKSTTIRVLLGMLRSDEGRAELFGADPWKHAAELHRRLAYVPGDVALWPGLSGGETIDLLGRLRGGIDKAKRDELLERFDLDPRKKGRSYSKGNRQKVALVAAFAADVDLLLLDEPTSGLDPLMGAVFNECVKEASAQGRTVLLSSHIMSEVEALCDRVSIIRKGVIAESGSLAEMRHFSRSRLRATLKNPVRGLEDHDGVHGLKTDGLDVECDVDTAALDDVLAQLAVAGVAALTCEPPSLEQIFLRFYGDELAASGVTNGEGNGS